MNLGKWEFWFLTLREIVSMVQEYYYLEAMKQYKTAEKNFGWQLMLHMENPKIPEMPKRSREIFEEIMYEREHQFDTNQSGLAFLNRGNNGNG